MSTSLRKALNNQYYAALATLRQTIVHCPDSLWEDPQYPNPYWRVAYHALYYAHLYLEKDLESFTPWDKERPGYHDLGNPPPDTKAYTQEDLLEYCQFCLEKAEREVETVDLDAPESGFSWYQMPKLEHQIVNIRHIQHHAAQLADRLRNAAGMGTAWVRGR